MATAQSAYTDRDRTTTAILHLAHAVLEVADAYYGVGPPPQPSREGVWHRFMGWAKAVTYLQHALEYLFAALLLIGMTAATVEAPILHDFWLFRTEPQQHEVQTKPAVQTKPGAARTPKQNCPLKAKIAR